MSISKPQPFASASMPHGQAQHFETGSKKTVGILGGGQLARMMVLAGKPLGLDFLIFDRDQQACAAQVAPLIAADYADHERLAEFANRVDVVTFDFENVPAPTAEWLAERVGVFPNPRALALAQDRLAEKRLFNQLGIPTPQFAAIDALEDLKDALESMGFPAILKTRRLGYDGKGQYRIRSTSDIEPAWTQLRGAPSILEAFVPFESEVSIIAACAQDGAIAHYALTENWHDNGILSASLAPANMPSEITEAARDFSHRLAEALAYVGVFALELFVHEGRLLANEIAPRVHNSGHWTIEGAETCQFENHLRAVLGLPLGSTELRSGSAMLNWVGHLPDPALLMREPRAHWHDYGKQALPGRKLGHATITSDHPVDLAARLEHIAANLDLTAKIEPLLTNLTRA